MPWDRVEALRALGVAVAFGAVALVVIRGAALAWEEIRWENIGAAPVAGVLLGVAILGERR